MSTLSVGTIQSNTSAPPVINNTSGTQIGTFCRAWVNFNGTGTVAIRASFNVSSITDNGTGDYTVNLTTAMPDADYSFSGAAGTPGTSFSIVSNRTTTQTSSTLRIGTYTDAGSLQDNSYVNVAIFR